MINIDIDINDDGEEIIIAFLIGSAGQKPSDSETELALDLFDCTKQASSSIRHQKGFPTKMVSNIPPS